MLMVGDEQTTNRQAYELFFCNMRFDLPKLKKLHTKFSAEQIEAEKKTDSKIGLDSGRTL